MRNVDALLAAADQQAKEDIVNILSEPSRLLFNVIHNRAVDMQNPDFQKKAWKSDIKESGW